jgi:serine/threonine protein kinase
MKAVAEAPIVLGRYAIYDKIAVGGTASVHFGRLAGVAGFARTVAIKRLHPHLADDPEFIAMMIDEARLAARISHPNVVQTVDVATVDRELLVVMEYVRGESLGRLLRLESLRQGRVPLPIVSAVMTGALYGLHAAHEAKSDRGEPLGIVHRDMSPQNVLVGVDGVARVIDFGVAKAEGRIQSTRDGHVKGKLAYIAPEQLSREPTTRAADIYAAGVVLWEMLTGRRLFQAGDGGELVAKVLAGPTCAPSAFAPHVPSAVDAVAMRALARDPGARFETALAMAEALAQAAPPALATEVGTWVQEVAKDDLDTRAARLDAIESSSSTVPSVPATAITPGAPREARPSSPVWTRTIAGLVAIVGIAVLLWTMSARSVRPREDPVPEAARAPEPVVVHVGETPSSPTGYLGPAPPPPASGPEGPSAVAVPEPAPAPTRAQSRPPRRRTDCNPPFTVDAIGVRVPKPGCY